MSLEYIRQYYGVPAWKGAVVFYRGKRGEITGASGPHLTIRLDGEKHSNPYHPTCEIEYEPRKAAWKEAREA